MLRIHYKEYEALRAHGEETYPNECCGVLLGKNTPGNGTEAMNHDHEEWGEDSMIACAHRLFLRPDCTDPAQRLLTCIFEAADKFTAGAPQHDDMTLLVCTVS